VREREERERERERERACHGFDLNEESGVKEVEEDEAE